jgi:acyl-CoA thioesterase I
MKNTSQALLFSFIIVLAIACGERATEKKSLAGNKDSPEVLNNGNATPVMDSPMTKTIIFFGNSLTAGYGVEPAEAFPALIQRKLDSAGFAYKVINAGVSGETTAGGNNRVDWILQQKTDIFVLELGGNDGLRGTPVAEAQKNLQSIIDKVKTKYPQAHIILAGMLIPPNLGTTYTAQFREVYPALAKKNKVALIPFILNGVGGDPRFNQSDGIHPTPEGHKIVAENVWAILKKEL